MGLRESSKVTKTARLLLLIQERATCSLTEPGWIRAHSLPCPGLAPARFIHNLTIQRWAPFPVRTPGLLTQAEAEAM